MSSLILREYEGRQIRQRADGYMSATDMAKATGKKVSHYLASDATRAFLAGLESEAGIPASVLVEARKGVRSGESPAVQGTWMHPHVAMHFAQWCSVKLQIAVARWLYSRLEDAEAMGSDDRQATGLSRFVEPIVKMTLQAIVPEIVAASRVRTKFAEAIPEGLRKYIASEVRGRFIHEGLPLKRVNAVTQDVRLCLEAFEYTHQGRLVYDSDREAPEFRVRKGGPPFGMYYIHRDHMPLFDEAYRKTIAATPRLRRNAAPSLFDLGSE